MIQRFLYDSFITEISIRKLPCSPQSMRPDSWFPQRPRIRCIGRRPQTKCRSCYGFIRYSPTRPQRFPHQLSQLKMSPAHARPLWCHLLKNFSRGKHVQQPKISFTWCHLVNTALLVLIGKLVFLTIRGLTDRSNGGWEPTQERKKRTRMWIAPPPTPDSTSPPLHCTPHKSPDAISSTKPRKFVVFCPFAVVKDYFETAIPRTLHSLLTRSPLPEHSAQFGSKYPVATYHKM